MPAGWERDEAAKIANVILALERSGHLAPLSGSPDEGRSWQNHDLACLVENRLGVMIDPVQVADAERPEWLARASDSGDGLAAPDSPYHKAYWIVDGARRIGTMAVATSTLGNTTLRVSSLYVLPAERKRGHARRALGAAYSAALGVGLHGIRLATDWSWQSAVRFYLGLGMWVWGWKRSLDFVWLKDLPPWRIEVEEDDARFSVQINGAWQVLIAARRAGDRLDWTSRTSSAGGEIPYLAPGTFALALALRGFPLITSEAAWREQIQRGFSDCGDAEGLAFKIRRFEAWDRKHGWLTPAPRIPGLDYPSWDEG